MIVGWGVSGLVSWWAGGLVKTAVICRLSAIGRPLSAVGFRLSAIRYPLTAGHSHSERSEESRCLLLVPPLLINTCRWRNIRHTVFLSAEGRVPEALSYMWL